MNQRATIATVVFIAGAAAYLLLSGAPPRVHVVTIGIDLCLFATVTFFLCTSRLSLSGRLIGASVAVIVIGVASTWLFSNVIAALNPLDVVYFIMGVVSAAIQSLLFAGFVWVVDVAMKRLRTHST